MDKPQVYLGASYCLRQMEKLMLNLLKQHQSNRYKTLPIKYIQWKIKQVTNMESI
jgi:hypothetical protein